MVLALDLIANKIFTFLLENVSSKFRNTGKVVRFRRSKCIVLKCEKRSPTIFVFNQQQQVNSGNKSRFVKLSATLVFSLSIRTDQSQLAYTNMSFTQRFGNTGDNNCFKVLVSVCP